MTYVDPIEIHPYTPQWPQEFKEIGKKMRSALGEIALRIDHIGSTSIPGLAAKANEDGREEMIWAQYAEMKKS